MTDLNGPTDAGVSFVVPDGVAEVDEGPGKRAYQVTDDASLMVGVARGYYGVKRSGLLAKIDPGDQPARVLAALQSRDDLQILARGQVEVDGAPAPVLAFRMERNAEPTDFWCYQDEIACYKLQPQLNAQQVLIPWDGRLLTVHSEWTVHQPPPAELMAARDEILASLRTTR